MPRARPRQTESDARRREFVRLVASGTPLAQAAKESRILPLRALAILDEPEMRQVIAYADPGEQDATLAA